MALACTAQALAADTAPRRYALPSGQLRLSDARLQAGLTERVTFTVKLTRPVARGTLELTLPSLWLARHAISHLAYAKVPAKGTASSRRARVRRRGRVVRFAFTNARQGDLARFTVTDSGLPADVYKLRYRWREDGAVRKRGTASVAVFVAPRPPR
jgi:hypothetical protein